MKSIAFFNNKGGVGKTTLLCNVAAYLAQEYEMKICVVDADPQCNATQYFFKEDTLASIYANSDQFTIYKIIEPLSIGDGYTDDITPLRSENFGVDVIPGDPKLAMTEDLIATDWQDTKSGNVRGIKTSLVFSDLLSRLTDYDLVLFDVSPSLGAINRSILLSSDYFLSPMSIDIFSLMAFENIAKWIEGWLDEWKRGLNNVKDQERIPKFKTTDTRFIGYVTQQYIAKKDSSGKQQAVQAFEKIRQKIDATIEEHFKNIVSATLPYEIGSVPNLYSLVPMSQSHNKPIFSLQSKDGVVGAHFAKVNIAKKIFFNVSSQIMQRINDG